MQRKKKPKNDKNFISGELIKRNNYIILWAFCPPHLKNNFFSLLQIYFHTPCGGFHIWTSFGKSNNAFWMQLHFWICNADYQRVLNCPFHPWPDGLLLLPEFLFSFGRGPFLFSIWLRVVAAALSINFPLDESFTVYFFTHLFSVFSLLIFYIFFKNVQFE